MLVIIFRKASLDDKINSAALSMRCFALEVILTITYTLIERNAICAPHPISVRHDCIEALQSERGTR
jgi:hypothetical protein